MFNGAINQLVTAWRLMRDPRVPMWTKAVPVLALLYVISPVDFVPDLVPGLGQLDDIGIVLAALRLFESLAPSDVVNEVRGKVKRENVVQGKAKRV